MSSDRDPNAIRLPDDVAQRLLARATELDDRSGRTSIDQLRRAANEAGISPAAFEAALAELARGELGRPASAGMPAIDVRGRWVTSPLRRGLLVAAAAVSLLLIGVGVVRSVTTAAPVPEAVQVDVVPMDVTVPEITVETIAVPVAPPADVAPADVRTPPLAPAPAGPPPAR